MPGAKANLPSAWPTGAGVTPALPWGSWRATLSRLRMHWDHEPVDCAVASWTAPVLWRFWLARLHRQSASRRRAEAALWRAAKAGRLAHSKTWRGLPRFMENLLSHLRMPWENERFRIPLNRPPGTFSPIGGEGWDEGVRFMGRPRRCGFLGLALLLASLRIAVAPVVAAEPATSERPVPPPGIRIPDQARKELETEAQSLAQEIDSLRVALKERPDKLELLPDVQIFHKAVDWALRHDEFYRSYEVQIARALLSQGNERAAWLRNGEAPWTSATGLVVRGYASRIDGSVQPYGLVVPATFARDPEKALKAGPPVEHRLDIWLHGRDDHLTELKFISDRQRSSGEFAPTNAFVLHPYGRYCNAFKFAGETDVVEALDHVKKHYPIDRNRVAMRGFSMGGAGCWHLGTHHASEWAVVAPGAGFANTADYLKLSRGQGGPPGYEQKLWHLYDSTGYALNLFN